MTKVYIVSLLTRSQIFFRAMHSSLDLALLDFAFVCVSGLHHPYMSSKVT